MTPYDIEALQADGAQEAEPVYTPWIRPEPHPFSAQEIRRRAGIPRLGRYDAERAAPQRGPLFHDPGCGYLWVVHPDPDRCPTEAEARAAFGDL